MTDTKHSVLPQIGRYRAMRPAIHNRVSMTGSRYADLIRASCQPSSSGQATQTGRTHDCNTCFWFHVEILLDMSGPSTQDAARRFPATAEKAAFLDRPLTAARISAMSEYGIFRL